MAEFETYKNPPIVEALMDVRVIPGREFEVETLGSIHDTIKDRYENIQKQHVIGGSLKIGKETTFDSQEPTFNGYMIRSEQEKKVVQSRLDGFTFSKLTPYESWEQFFSEGQSLLSRYIDITNPTSIFRAALRYINRIEIPIDFNDFSEYILTNPQIAPGIPQAVSNFFLRLEIPNHDIGSKANVSLTLDKLGQNSKVPIIFDIDVYCEEEFVNKPQAIVDKLIALRKFKNEIFFNTITDKCKEMFR